MSRPLVGLLACTEYLDAVPYAAVRDVYLRALTGVAGCQVVVLPTDGLDLSTVPEWLDGVVLGGHQSNVDPVHYGGDPDPDGHHDPARDAAAIALARAAVAADLPLLGVCRGLQELNVALGGTLRSVAGHTEDAGLPRDRQYLPAHEVTLVAGGLLAGIFGRPSVAVNSLHGQAVAALAPGLRPEAHSGDRVIEAASVPGAGFALGVQWHPEWYAATDETARGIFEAFGKACLAYHARA